MVLPAMPGRSMPTQSPASKSMNGTCPALVGSMFSVQLSVSSLLSASVAAATMAMDFGLTWAAVCIHCSRCWYVTALAASASLTTVPSELTAPMRLAMASRARTRCLVCSSPPSRKMTVLDRLEPSITPVSMLRVSPTCSWNPGCMQ